MNKRLLIGFFVCSLLSPPLALGEVYQWVDEQGRVHFGNVPPKQQDVYRLGEINIMPLPRQVPEDSSAASTLPSVSAKNNLVPQNSTATLSNNNASSNKQELEGLIQGLLKRAEVARLLKTESMAVKPKSELPLTQPLESVTNTSRMPAESTSEVGKTIHRSETDSSNTKQAVVEKDADKCGVFNGFVNSYQRKVAEECPGPHCNVYKRSLKKHLLRQNRYC